MWSEILREAIRDSGKTTYAISKESGVPQPTVHRFLEDGAEPKFGTAERIASIVGVTLRKKKTRRKRSSN